jgi:hypothetical protein
MDFGLWAKRARQDMKANFTMICLRTLSPGANPTIASYNSSVVNFYNATGSLAHFENKNIFF